jgi:F-type H+-transporting ATPase subunit epsilon
MSIRLSIAAVDEILFRGEADSVTLPAVSGTMTVLPKHMPLISALGRGTVIVRVSGKTSAYNIPGGFADVGKSEVMVLVSPESPQKTERAE